MKEQSNRRERGESVEKRDKELLALDRERRRLRRVVCDAPLVPLEKPFQRGWTRRFVLTDQAKRRPDFEDLCALLPVIERRQFCRDEAFRKHVSDLGPMWQKEKGGLVEPHPHEAIKCVRPLRLISYYERQGRYQVTGVDGLLELIRRKWNGRLYFRYPHLLAQVVEANIVTHRRVHYPQVEARLHEIDELLSRDGRLYRLDWLYGYSNRRWRSDPSRNKLLAKLAEKEIRQEMQGGGEDPPPFSLLGLVKRLVCPHEVKWSPLRCQSGLIWIDQSGLVALAGGRRDK